MRTFLAAASLVTVIFLALLFFPPPDWLDTVILLGVAVAYTIGWAQMLVFRRVWTPRAVGIFWTALADATVYLALGVGKFGHFPTWALDLARAAFIVGAPLFALGTIRYLTRRTPPSPRSDGLP